MDKKMRETTGEKIKRLRIAKGLSQEDVGKACGCNKATVHYWETGRIEGMGITKVNAISKLLGVSPLYLLGWDEPKSPDDELKFALFGGESATDEELEEVRQFVEFVKAKRKNK